MKRIIPILFFSLFFIEAYACKPKAIMSVQHTPCFGKCANFKVTVYNNGFVEYDGGEFANRIGKFHKKISKQEVKELRQKFRDADFFNFKDEYTAPVTDMPTTYVIFTDKGKTKKVTDYFDAPGSLRKLEVLLNNIADDKTGWIEDAPAK